MNTRTLAERCVSESAVQRKSTCRKAAAQSACGAKTSCVRPVHGNIEVNSKREAPYAVNAQGERKNSGIQRVVPARRVVNNKCGALWREQQLAGGAGRLGACSRGGSAQSAA